MRKDMYKVIVERPRTGGHDKSKLTRSKSRGKKNPDTLPVKESMKLRHGEGKSLNENLAPLWRWLRKQVGRPWDKIFSEAVQLFDGRSAVKDHVRQHLVDNVETDCEMHGKEVHKKTLYAYESSRIDTLLTSRYARRGLRFYVHPKTRLLCLATYTSG